MSSLQPGNTSSEVEVTNISKNGIWVLVLDEEIFLSKDDFPWFNQAKVAEILEVELVSPRHLYWPKLDIDLGLDTIKEPQRFPVKARIET
ncbi:MAG: DUF2442 domain-containing protein [Gammaproteobacteria bacterium]|nr:DUF2442 domain-containing protein [Gammaproteobacteria bacterium]